MKFRCILAEKACFPVSLMCRCLRVSRSGFYAWLNRRQSARALRDQVLLVSIKASHQRSRERYGSPRVHRDLVEEGIRVGKGRVERLMREAGLCGRRTRRFVRTTHVEVGLPVVPNVLGRQFEPTKPNAVWAGDITYVPTLEGWLYLAVLLDLFSRKVVGWSISKRVDTALIKGALEMALKRRAPQSGLLHHSDRGCQYASFEYREELRRKGIEVSMSRTGNCWDNAVVESFFATLKTELLEGAPIKTYTETRREVFEYIEVFYNRQRRHSTLAYLTPEQYERGVKRAA